MSAYLRFELLPVETMETIQADKIDLIDKLTIVMVTHGASKDVHLCARGQEDGSSQVMLVEAVFEVRETIEDLSCSLVVAHVDDLVIMENVRVFNILLNSVFDELKH